MFISPVIAAPVSGGTVLLIAIGLFVIFAVALGILARIKKCPSDRVMVIYGSVLFHHRTATHAARCIHGGTAFIWPVIQDYGFLSLRPIQLEVNLKNALCKQNIRINVPSVFTVGVSTDEAAIIGDRMDTDVIAGVESGIDTVLVLSGVTTREEMSRFPYRPRYVLNGVGDVVG